MPSRDEFEELRRQFRRQFGRFPGVRKKLIASVVLGAVILVAALWAAASSYYTVEADEVGVVLRLGRYSDTTQPGLHFKLPFGIDTVALVKVNRVLKEEFGYRTAAPGVRTQYSQQEFEDESLMLTADLGIADVEWIVQYRIKDPRAFLFNIKDVRATLRDVSEYVARLEVGDSSIDEVITSRRRTIADSAKERMQAVLDEYEAGIEIVTVELQNVNPPQEVQDSFNEVNRAIQEKQTKINEAHKVWNQEIPQATGQAAQQIEAAEGYKLKRVNEAEGDVARFNAIRAEYAKAKEVTRARLYIEALEEVLPRISRIWVVDGGGGGPLQILDLEAAGASAAQRRSAADTAAQPAERRR